VHCIAISLLIVLWQPLSGYVYGNPRNWPFEHWINQSPNVVIVSVYYRLDSFGFLAHPSFSNSASGSSTKPADLNAGFLDQVASLQWVHDHIAAFGGDPARVTINGESAGGSSVVLHMVGNSASKLKQLFSGAIAQSIYRTPLATPAQMEVRFPF
jgi:carboxylesterase type B